MRAFIKRSRSTSAWELRRAYMQGSYLENHDWYYLQLEKPSWLQAGADNKLI